MNLRNKTVLVTGAAGFIGSHLVDRLINEKSRVISIDNLSFGNLNNINPQSIFKKRDILTDNIGGMIEDVDLVFHFAASATTKESQMGWNDPIKDFNINSLGTLRILEAIRRSSSSAPLIYASSAAVYGAAKQFPIKESDNLNPISPYGVSKLTGEKYGCAYTKEFGLKVTSLRIFNTYGPRQPRYVIYDLFRKIEEKNEGEIELLGTGEEIREYCFVNDTVEAAIVVAKRNLWNEVYNVSGNNPIRIKNLAQIMIKKLGKEGKLEVLPTGFSWKGDITRLEADISKIRSEGFSLKYTLEEGLNITLKEFHKNSSI